MKNKASWKLVAATVIGVFLGGNSFAAGLHGSDYVDFEAGAFKYGDEVVDDLLGTHADFLGAVNKKITSNVDLLASGEFIFAYKDKDGIKVDHEGVKAGLRLNLLLAPGKAIAPYLLAGGLYEYNRLAGTSDSESASKDDSDFGGEAGGGVEFDLAPLLIDANLIYQKFQDFDTFATEAKLALALNEKIIPFVVGRYAFDEKDISCRIGLAVKF